MPKAASWLLILAILLIAVGGILSYSGYSESLQTVTVTNTQSFTVSSTNTIASTSTESIVTMTSGTHSILSQTFDLDGIGTFGGSGRYCGIYHYLDQALEAGNVHVSYKSEARANLPGTPDFGTKVEFWMLTPDQWHKWETAESCQDVYTVPAIVRNAGAGVKDAYEFTTSIQSAGVYYFVFMNKNRNLVSITLNIDAPYQGQVTLTEYHTSYSTQVTAFPAQTVSIGSHPAGLGLLFFSGIALAVVGIGLAISSRLRRAPGPAPAPTGAVPSPAVTTVAVTEGQSFCIHCGNAIPSRAVFCNLCGREQK